jgi:site-specific recombinase XerD
MQARNLAGQSQRSYVRAVKQLSDYYEINPAKLTQTQIQHFILHLANEKKLCWDSCNAYTSGIRFFYKVVLGKNLGDFYIPLAKTAKKIPDILPRTEIEELFAHVTLDKYRLMFMIMYSAGLRISEVVKLIASYIDSSEGVIVVRAGKGNKDRYAPLSNQVLIELRKYWKKYRPVSCLFPSRRTQKPISPRTVRFYFAKALAQTTIKKQVSTHSLRHSFATHLLEAGTNIINIKQCLGHALLSSTLRYARFSKPIIANVGFPFDK